ncbi:MAG: alpha/beta hydrolase family protein [Pseudomonadota bacterium]|nr:alpha/beta hydrolase family protein [Pseudomonadota bacterium]
MSSLKLRILFAAFIRKIKKIVHKQYDDYGIRPKNLFLSPSLGIFENIHVNYRNLSFINSSLEPKQWQSVAREKLIELVGYQAKRPSVKTILTQDFVHFEGSCSRSKFYLRVNKLADVPVTIIRPECIKQKGKPVLIFLAGSTSGVHVGWGEVKVPIDHHRVSCGSDILLRAAKDGYFGVGIEQAGFGERQEKHLHKKSSSRTADAFCHLVLQGRSLLGLGATEVSSVIDWLIDHAHDFGIDRKKIYIFGHSSGGTLAQYCGALDPRIAGVMASGSVGFFESTIARRGVASGVSVVPGILNWFEASDVISLMAPRLFIAVSGHEDHIFPFDGAKSVVEEASTIFEKLNAASSISALRLRGGHRYYGQPSWEYFKLNM